jgi:orotate phosphoribosyltransferase-like protein
MEHYRDGTHIDFPTVLYRADELVAEAERLELRGLTRREVAQQLGVKWGTIVTARWRLRRRAAAARQREQEELNHEADHECG